MDTTERLLALLGLLQRQRDWSADALAARLDVTTRTIRRDVGRLRAYGYPVESFAGHGGGYQLGRGGVLPPLLLDDDEALAILLGLRLTGFAALAGIDDAAMSALGKIEQLLPHRLRQRLDDLDAVTFVDLHTQSSDRTVDDRRTFTALARAAASRLTVTFHYIDRRATQTSRRVEPTRLVRTRLVWYLAAYDLGRDDWRTFRLDRITDAEVTDQRFAHRDGPDPVALVEAAAPPDAFGTVATVRLDCGAAEAAARIPPSLAVIASENDSSTCTITIGTDDEDWLVRYLLSLPWGFDILTPGHLRQNVAATARAVAQRHAGDGEAKGSLGA